MGLGQFIASIPSEVFGTIPGWITAISGSSILALVVRWQLGLKKIQVEADQVLVNSKKVAADDDENIRQHWAEEVRSLREKLANQEKTFQDALKAQDERHAAQERRHNDALTAMEERHNRIMAAAERRQEVCELEREKLAVRVTEVEEELRGVRQQVRASSADQLRILAASDEPIPPFALEAAQRIVERSQR